MNNDCNALSPSSRRRRPLHNSLCVFFVDQRKPKSALRLNKRLRLRCFHHERSKQTRLLCLGSIVADPMSTPRGFEETVSGFENSHRLVVHLVEDCAG